ncbi:unnamed protein product [Diplocarpon coronariae]
MNPVDRQLTTMGYQSLALWLFGNMTDIAGRWSRSCNRTFPINTFLLLFQTPGRRVAPSKITSKTAQPWVRSSGSPPRVEAHR